MDTEQKKKVVGKKYLYIWITIIVIDIHEG